MLTKTALRHPTFLAKVKAAIVRAVSRTRHTVDGKRVRATTFVKNSRGAVVLAVLAYPGRGFEVFGGPECDDDVTPMVLAALREYHAALPRPRLRNVRLSFPRVLYRPSGASFWPCSGVNTHA